MSADSPPVSAAGTEPFDQSHQAAPASRRHAARRHTPFRFLQAADFRLDTPCPGISGLPSDIRQRHVEARYVAAQRVFDAAIRQQVDFVVLAGGLLDARLPGLRGPWFLTEQFRRLCRHGIDVYWAGASLETRGRWPAHLDLPSNVHRLSSDTSGILHGRGGHPLARLLSLPAGMTQSRIRSETFTIAVQPHRESTSEQLADGIDYWALGGRPNSETIPTEDRIVHFCGSPQGRGPAEAGRHGCSLIEVDAVGAVHIEPIATDVVRWHHLEVDIDARESWSDLEARLDALQSPLRTETEVDVCLIDWTVQGSGAACERLLQHRFHAEMLGRLNRHTAEASPRLWSCSLETIIEPQQRWESMATLLGAFLRELDELSPHVEELFGSPTDARHPLGVASGTARQQILGQVVTEAVHWLGTGDDTLPEVV